MKRRTFLTTLLAGSLAAASLTGVARAADAGFSFDDKKGEHLDVLLDGKVVTRYMYAHDTSTKERAAETYKPYLHVFDAEGKGPITKGPGGQFTHHRGIFIGWNKISFEGKSYDRWHMKGGDIVHQTFSGQKADADQATFTSNTLWQADKPDRAIIEEERTMTIRKSGPGRIVIDFTSKLKAPNGEVKLDGDPEHAGIHFRPADEVDTAAGVYTYPKDKADAHKDTDYPWVGQTFKLNGKSYSVVEMSHPTNPQGTRWSAYRNYGRFGAFPTATIKQGESLTVKYRFVVADGQMLPVDAIQKSYDEYAGATSPSPVPTVTVKPAEGAKPAAPKAPAAAKTPATKSPAAPK